MFEMSGLLKVKKRIDWKRGVNVVLVVAGGMTGARGEKFA
jgi:hypothetical protein